MSDRIDFDGLFYSEPISEGDKTMPTQDTNAVPVVTITLDTEIGGRVDYDEDGTPIGRGRTIADAIIASTVEKLTTQLRKEAEKIVRETVKEQIAYQASDLIADVISSPMQLTNQFGEPTGKIVTVRGYIDAEVKDQLTRRQDNYDRKASVLTQIIQKEVNAALNKELRDAVTEARNVVVAAVKNQAASLLAKAVRDGLGS